MKKLVVLIFSSLIICSCGDELNVYDYNTLLVEESNRVGDAVSDFFYELENDDYVKAEQKRQIVIKVCDSVIADMEKIGGFDGDKQLVNILIDYVEMQKSLAKKEYKGLVETDSILSQIDRINGEPDVIAMDKAYEAKDRYNDSIEYKDSVYFQKVKVAQQKFANKYGFGIEGDTK